MSSRIDEVPVLLPQHIREAIVWALGSGEGRGKCDEPKGETLSYFV